ncbi:MAG: nitroreductase [Candidatus Moranbacteria bacterium]|nr:nitroreductase [Candidatus Moranbacteria bacterium]
MRFKDLVKKNRSYRRFKSGVLIKRDFLEELVQVSRFTPSSRNLQPLRYYLAFNKKQCDSIFQCLGWAKNLRNWKGPEKNKKPSAYIVILFDKKRAQELGSNVNFDVGISAQTMLLAAAVKGYCGCMLASVNKVKLTRSLNISDKLEIALVVALGKKGERIVLEDIDKNQDTMYYRDNQDIHHVPKIVKKDLIIN